MARNSLRDSLWIELTGHGDHLLEHWAASEAHLQRWPSLAAMVEELDRFPEVDALTALARLSQSGDRRAGLVVMMLMAGPRAWRIVGRTNARFRYSAISEGEVLCEAWELLHRLNPRVWVMETYMWEITRRITTRLARDADAFAELGYANGPRLDDFALDSAINDHTRNASHELMEVFAAVRAELSRNDTELITAWFAGTVEDLANRDHVSTATMQRRKDRAMRRLVDAARAVAAAG